MKRRRKMLLASRITRTPSFPPLYLAEKEREIKSERERARERVRELEEAPFWVVQKTDR